MAALWKLCVFLLAALSYVVATDDAKILADKFRTLKVETFQTAKDVRNITIRIPQGKVQLAAMASDFIVALNQAVFLLNTLVPNIFEYETHKRVADAALILANYSNAIQQALSRDTEQLKEKLATILEKLSTTAAQAQNKILDVSSHFVHIQVRKATDAIIYGVSKLKYGAGFFNKSNKELLHEIRNTATHLIPALKALPNDEDTEEKLRDLLLHIFVVVASDVYKLTNWVEINLNANDDVKVAEEIALFFGSIYANEIELISVVHNASFIKANFISIYETVLNHSTSLANIEYDDNLGGLEFIRSTIMDIVAVPRMIAENIKSSFLRTMKIKHGMS